MTLIVESRQFGGGSSLGQCFGLSAGVLTISALTPVVSESMPFFSWLLASVGSFIVKSDIVCCGCLWRSSWSFVVVDVSSSSSAMPGRSYLLVSLLSCVCVTRTFLRLVLLQVVFFSSRKLLNMSAVVCSLSLFFDRTYRFS